MGNGGEAWAARAQLGDRLLSAASGRSSFLFDVTPVVTPKPPFRNLKTANTLISLARSERFELPTLRFEV
jgi:hypothetical protein